MFNDAVFPRALYLARALALIGACSASSVLMKLKSDVFSDWITKRQEVDKTAA